MTNLQDYLPQPSTWFSKTLTYVGDGRIEFSNPQGWVEGKMICEVNHVGDMSVVLEIREWGNENEPNEPQSILSRDWLISGVRVESKLSSEMCVIPIPPPTNNSITSMTLKTTEGDKLTSEKISNYTWDPIRAMIRLYVDVATYSVNNKSKGNAKYWMLPCINLNLHLSFGVIKANNHKNLKQHPLRIFPVTKKIDDFLSSETSEEDKAWVRHNLTAMSLVVAFCYNNELAFIERLPDYNQITQDLANGVARLGVTSVMVGVCSSKSESDETHPADVLLPTLSLATGRHVGASWIEFRDENGGLVYRIHANLGRYTYGRGRPIIDDLIHQGGLGRLLTQASQSNAVLQSAIHKASDNAALAISGEDTTQVFYYLFTAFDELFTHYNIEEKIHPIKISLTEEQIRSIKDILKETADKIKQLESTPDERRTIEKVADSVCSQPLQKRTSFGDKLIALLTLLKFVDRDVVSKYYGNSDDWARKVSDYRNRTMHRIGYKDIHKPETRQEFEAIIPHLVDILIRMLLKAIGYEGKYAPFMKGSNFSEPLDWVSSSTPSRELGYK
ncbi:MAG TPA: hypothetical protein PLD47_03000 [Aggregatilineales bacterium]|nr:hypothetical protein [Anaerolineales bacterium]HRE46667.1 hypothetical protein [Aggregatilineales bacterium]